MSTDPTTAAESDHVVTHDAAPLATPVLSDFVGRHVGRDAEHVVVTDLAHLDPDTVDMSTIVVIGSSTTRVLDRPHGSSVYTPRNYPSALPCAESCVAR